MRRSEVKTIHGGKSCCVSRACLIKDHLPTHFLGNPQRWQLLTLKKKKKCMVEEAKRIIFKKEHNLTFLSTTHSTPPPHSLVSPPACSSISLFFPSLSPGCSVSHTFSHAFPSLCPKLGGSSDTTLGRTVVRARGCCQAQANKPSSSSELQMCGNQNTHSLLRSPALT